MELQIIVWNRKTQGVIAPLENRYVEFVGKPRTLAGPFLIGVHGKRNEVMGKYRLWLWNYVESKKGRVYESMVELLEKARKGDLYLVCSCAPLPCHGDVIKKCLLWMNRENPVAEQTTLFNCGTRIADCGLETGKNLQKEAEETKS